MSHAANDSLDENSPLAPSSGISLITRVFFALYTQRIVIFRLMSKVHTENKQKVASKDAKKVARLKTFVQN